MSKGGSIFVSGIDHELSERVPEDIHNLFEVTRGTMTYGYYYYPVFTIALEQLFRIMEVSVSHICEVLGIPASIKTYSQKIEWLVETGILENSKKAGWDTLRRMRNSSSHPKSQMILPPGPTIAFFHEMTNDINSLFDEMDKARNQDA